MTIKPWLFASLFSAPLAFAAGHSHDEQPHDDHQDHNAHEAHREHDSHENASLEAHVHGAATLTIIIDQHDVLLELHSPAANIVGFEHEARTDAQTATVNKANEVLKDGEQLFSFTGSHCHLDDVQSNADVLLPDDYGHEHRGAAEHSEIEVSYAFHCDKAEKLTSVSTQLFKHFPNTEHLGVQWVSAKGQGAIEINATKPVVSLKGTL